MNWLMTVAVLLLLTIGVLFVYSAGYSTDEHRSRPLYARQLVWVVAGVACYFAFALADYRLLRRVTWWAYAVSLALLVCVLLVGTRISGAKRWLTVLGIGLQPSELAKLAAILVLARKLSRPGVNLGHVAPLLEILALVGAPFALIMLQPDLGTGMVFVFVTAAMMFAAGMPLRPLLVMAAIGVAALAVVLSLLFLPRALGVDEPGQIRIMRKVGLRPYHRDRIEVFLQADKDPLGAGWNKRQSELAVGSGGPWGKGLLNGTQNILGFLPRSVAPTDFIFSVIAEEKGFLGSTVVLGLFAIVLGSGLWAGLSAPDKWGRLLAAGVTAMVFFHAFVNIAMTVGLLPITGLPLPLLSYGGTFMVVMMSALGVVQSIHIRSHRADEVFEQEPLWQAG
jgi:rod shape determining protein RodA